MDNSGNDRNADDLIARQASKWAWKVDQGLTAHEQDEFFNWLGDDPKHGKEYRAHARDFKDLDQLIDWQPVHGVSPNPDLFAPSDPNAMQLFHRIVAATAVAALAAILLGIMFFRSSGEVTGITLSGGEMTLADSSRIHYKEGAQFEVDYTSSARRVSLKSGEAYFSVAKDPNRPFVVEAGGIELLAVGTAFNVRLGDEDLEVLIEEGIVEMNNTEHPDAWNEPSEKKGTHSRLLNQFTKAVVSLERNVEEPELAVITESELKQKLSWQHRMLVFEGVSLKDAVSEFNRLNEVQFVLESPYLEKLLISGTIKSDNVMGMCRLLDVSFGISNESLDSGKILLF